MHNCEIIDIVLLSRSVDQLGQLKLAKVINTQKKNEHRILSPTNRPKVDYWVTCPQHSKSIQSILFIGISVRITLGNYYRRATNLACGGTKSFSTTPYSSKPFINFFTWNCSEYLGVIQMAPPWRFLRLHF